MANCVPQRYVGNENNVLRTAALVPSAVLPVENQVIEIPAARNGTGRVALTGPFSGEEEATFDIEIVDLDASEPIVTAVVPSGAGSGTVSNIVAPGAAQTYTLELANDGVPTLAAAIDFEGVRIVARTPGAAGNLLALKVDQTGLTFTEQAFSLLDDLPAGAGGPSNELKGAAYDWDTKVLGADNIIPSNAHRVAFGDDRTNIYLAYKQFVDNEWEYHFVPAIRRAVPKGTIVKFVTGGRIVTVENGDSPPPEEYTGIITVYDLLNAIKTMSTLLDVSGVVANDRSPTGQAARELLLRTDAYAEPSTGAGSAAATGFENVVVNPNAATELITAECFAISTKDHPLARVGAERWHLRGSVSGELGDIVTGVRFADPNGKFALTIPIKLPPSYGQPTGRFTHVDTRYQPRLEAQKPPICPVALTLGSEAVDQTITLTWTQRPSGDCACGGMRIPKLSPFCLGLIDTGGGTLDYQPDTIVRLVALYDWYRTTVLARSSYEVLGSTTGTKGGAEEPAIGAPLAEPSTGTWTHGYGAAAPPFPPATLESIQDVVARFEETAALLDVVGESALRNAGFEAWDDAIEQFEDDIGYITEALISIPAERYVAALRKALISGGISPLGKSDADSITSGDGCWRDQGGDYWTVVGSDKGGYAPLFNNTPYYASRLSKDGKQYFSTKEFGLQLNIQCPDLLVYGDQVVLQIGGSGVPSTYQNGDRLVVPIIAGQNLKLAGGQNGNALLDFYISGSIDGAFPNYVFDPEAPAPYYQAGVLQFLYTPGGIRNRKGDKWTWATEGGHYRWRKDGGAWNEPSPLPAIATDPVAFDSGLSITFIPGASPSFKIGDTHSFRALQPWAVSNLRTPNARMWRWPGATPTLDVDAGAIVNVPGCVIARHTIPQGATIVMHGGDAAANEWSETLPWRAGVIAEEFATARTARYLRLELTGATGGGIGWGWAGVMLTTELSADMDVRDSYQIESGNTGLDDESTYFAQAVSGTISFQDEALTEEDAQALRQWIKWAKTHNNEPCVVIPNIGRPDEAFLVRVAVDELTWREASDYNATPGVRDRRYTIEVPLTGVWRA